MWLTCLVLSVPLCWATLRPPHEEVVWCPCPLVRQVLHISPGALVVVVPSPGGDVSCLHEGASLLLGDSGEGGKARGYVVFLGQGEGLEAPLETLRRAAHWNSRARLVVCYEGRKRPAVEPLERWKVHNAVLVGARGALLVPKLYKDLHSCGKVVWRKVTSLQTSVLFPNERLRDVAGCEVVVSVVEEPPYVVTAPGGGYDGLDVQTALTALRWLKATPTLVATDPHFGAGWYENETWTGMLGDLVRGRRDVAASGFVLVRERLLAVDAVYPHVRDAAVWVVPRARRLAPWRSLLRCLGADVWLASAAAAGVATLALGGATALCRPQTWPRTMAPAALGASLLASVYRSALLATLLDPGREAQVKTLGAATAAGLRFAYEPVMEYFLQEEPSVRGRRDVLVSPRPVFELVAGGRHAALTGRQEARYFHNFLLGDRIFLFPEDFVSYDACLYVAKGHALLQPLTDAVFRLQAAGLLPKWEADVARKARLRVAAPAAPDDRLFVLSLRHMQGAFVFLGVGVLVSAVVMLVEVCMGNKTTPI